MKNLYHVTRTKYDTIELFLETITKAHRYIFSFHDLCTNALESNMNHIRSPIRTVFRGIRWYLLAMSKYILIPNLYHVSRTNYDTIEIT